MKQNEDKLYCSDCSEELVKRWPLELCDPAVESDYMLFCFQCLEYKDEPNKESKPDETRG